MNTMGEYRFVANDEDKKRAIYLLGSIRLKGFVSEHGMDGLYWFNTKEGLEENNRDFLVSAANLKVLI